MQSSQPLQRWTRMSTAPRTYSGSGAIGVRSLAARASTARALSKWCLDSRICDPSRSCTLTIVTRGGLRRVRSFPDPTPATGMISGGHVTATAPTVRPQVEAAVAKTFRLPAHLIFLSESEAREPELLRSFGAQLSRPARRVKTESWMGRVPLSGPATKGQHAHRESPRRRAAGCRRVNQTATSDYGRSGPGSLC